LKAMMAFGANFCTYMPNNGTIHCDR
jgi:hypothetical protein